VTASLGFIGLRDRSISASSLCRILVRHLALDRLDDAETRLHVMAADV
jgi:hypothetical protein